MNKKNEMLSSKYELCIKRIEIEAAFLIFFISIPVDRNEK